MKLSLTASTATAAVSRVALWTAALGLGVAVTGWTPSTSLMAQAAPAAQGQPGQGQPGQGQGRGQGQGQGQPQGQTLGGGQAGGGAQGGRGGRGRGGPPPGPTPRSADGKVLLGGATPAVKGVWLPVIGITAPIAPVDRIPFQPWARALYDDRQLHEFEPHARCKASGVSRQFETPYGVEFVDLNETKRLYVFDIGGPHTYRTVYMDGRTHPANLTPSYYGHSIGWWDGDTLVIDSTGFNEGFWLERRGLPHTDRLHTIERFTRTDSDTIRYEVTIDDPGAYTAPWTGGFNLRWESGTELFEYVCQQANYANELMVGQLDSVDRTSPYIP
jgi:hypothetical protein